MAGFEGTAEQEAFNVNIEDYGTVNLNSPSSMENLRDTLDDARDPQLVTAVETALQPYPEHLSYIQENSEYMQARGNAPGSLAATTLALYEQTSRTRDPRQVEAWRFHNTYDQYQSHGYQDRGDDGVSGRAIQDWRHQDGAAHHMYRSSTDGSYGVSYTRDLGALVDISQQTGADAQLSQTVRGDDQGDGNAAYLAQAYLPADRVVYPEDTPVPRHDTAGNPYSMGTIDRLGEARDRSIREGEVLYDPPSQTVLSYDYQSEHRGLAPRPEAVFENPYPASYQGESSDITRVRQDIVRDNYPKPKGKYKDLGDQVIDKVKKHKKRDGKK